MQKPTHESDSFDGMSVPAFSPFLDPISAYVADLPEAVKIPSGTLLIDQEQSPTFVGLIRSGIVKLSFGSDQGSEGILGLRSQGWWMNANLVLLNVRSLCSVHTITDCTISKIPTEEFAEKLTRNPLILRHYLFTQSRELLMFQQQMIMRGKSAQDRLRYLLGESSQSIWDTADPTRILRQCDIAELLGITPEHLSRVRGLNPQK